MKQIKDLTADELAEYALYVFILSGRNSMGAGLIYRCLELQPKHPGGLRCLSDFLDGQGSEVISAIVMEYLIKSKTGTPVQQKEFEDILFLSKWVWGFSAHQSGKTNLAAPDFEDKSQFITDHAAYAQFLETAIDIAGSKERVIQGAHHLAGLYAGLVHTPSLRNTHKPIDVLLFNDFERTADYNSFLQLGTEKLEDAKMQVKQMR